MGRLNQYIYVAEQLDAKLSAKIAQLELSDPEAAKTQLVATTDHVKDVVADVRRLVHDLRPPALDDRGLEGALVQLAESLNLPAEVVRLTGIAFG